MKTDDFISMLASGVTPVDRHAIAKRFSLALVIGLVCAGLLVLFGFGIRNDLAQMATMPIFWARIAFPSCMMIGALALVTRLARPGLTPGSGMLLVIATIAITWAGVIHTLMTASPDMRVAMVLGKTWRVCALNIAFLSIPGLVAVFWALRGLAPTRLKLAGACGGLLSGATATLAYCFHCPELDIPFWGVWYWLGMLIPTVIGSLLGQRWLRW